MNDNVFVVEEDFPLEGLSFRHIFLNLEEAKNWCKAQMKHQEFFISSYSLKTHEDCRVVTAMYGDT